MNFEIFCIQPEILTVEEIEHTFLKKGCLYHNFLVGIFVPLILVMNGYLLYFIFNDVSKKSFIDWMVIFDTILCCMSIFQLIGNNQYKAKTFLAFNSLVLVLPRGSFIVFTKVVVAIGYFQFSSNRLLSLGIVIYRYVFVRKYAWVETPSKRWTFYFIISATILIPSLIITIWSVQLEDYDYFALGEKYIHYQNYVALN